MRTHLKNRDSTPMAYVERVNLAIDHVVLLHLSQECNRPELAAMHHNGSAYKVTITGPERSSGWLRVAWAGAGVPVVRRGVMGVTPLLWDHN